MNSTESPGPALVITRNLPPLQGGMERLGWHIIDELRRDSRAHVIGPKGCRSRLPQGVTATELPLAPLPVFLACALVTALLQALRRQPRLILAGSGLTAPFAWLAARIAGSHCVVYLHGLDVDAPNRLYRWLWHPVLRSFDQVLVNSRYTEQLALDIGIAADRVAVLNPGVSLPDIGQAEEHRTEFRERYHLGASPVLLYVGRITPRKGLTDFLLGSFPKILARKPDARLVIVGSEPKHALNHRKGERARLTAAIDSAHLHRSVLFLQDISDDVLRSAYFAADVLVFPVQAHPNDHEGFGMVALEAAAHGLPTVSFAVGGVPDAVIEHRTGRLIAPGDNAAFYSAVLDYLDYPPSERSARIAEIHTHATRFAWPEFGARLRAICCAPGAPPEP